MKNVLIVENGTSSLKMNESVDNSTRVLLSGKFTEFDIENRNKRFYTADNFIPVMNNLLEKKKLLGVLYGEFDHPDVFDIAGKNASHAIESLTHNNESNCVDGSIALLSTHWGKEAKAIINDGYPLFVSSRAAGVTDSTGNVALKELFTYDIVLDPGFATSQVSLNESCGYKSDLDVPYRIYEMNDASVNNLHLDNKNDNKTQMDLKYMESMLTDKMVQLEHTIMEKIKNASGSPEELLSLSEKHELVNQELVAVKLYLEEFKKNMNILVKQNKALTETNQTLTNELNENTMYSNHLASGLKKLNIYAKDIENRLSVDEKMIEYVAEHSKNNILRTDSIESNINNITENVNNTTEFVEYLAGETKKVTEANTAENAITQKFLEYVANETKITQEFSENVARETEVSQKFIEYVANESFKDQVFLDYIGEKVDGLVGYQSNLVSKLKATTPISENVDNEDSIHTLESVEDFLGITKEKEILNNIEESSEEASEEDTEEKEIAVDVEASDDINNVPTTTTDATLDIDTNDTSIDISTEPVVTTEPVITIEASEEGEDGETSEEGEDADDTFVDATDNTEDVEDLTTTSDVLDTIVTDDTISAEIDNVEDTNMETELLQSVVKLLGSDDTGIIVEITPDNKVIIQKSGSDETITAGPDEYEVMNIDDNMTETVTNVLAEIKKQKVLSNQQPHFFSFMTEQQIVDFKNLDKETQNSIVLALDESEYYTANDVLAIIGETLNSNSLSYEDKLISNVPENLKEAWNALEQNAKLSVITESKYFALSTTADMKNFWATRPFAKAVTSPEATLIKESLKSDNTEALNEEYINAFMSSIDNMTIK